MTTEYLVNVIIDHPILFVVVVICLLSLLEKFKEILLCIITKGKSEMDKKKKPGDNKWKSQDDVLEPDYIIIKDKKEK